MSILVLHLSDIHFTENDKVLESRASMIVSAAFSSISNVTECHVLVSGDIANIGDSAEYRIASGFMERLKDEILKRVDSVDFFCVPGNHDCNFSGDQSSRDLLVDGIRNDPTKLSMSVAENCAIPLENYFEFQEQVSGAVKSSPWLSIKETGKEFRVFYVGLNSALLSKKVETQGKLYLPIDEIEVQAPDGAIVICAAHHPTNWLMPENARKVVNQVSSWADLFVMGHEHESGAMRLESLYESAGIYYTLGHVFNDKSNPKNSAFQVIEMDRDLGFKLSKYTYSNHRYEIDHAVADTEFHPWVRNERNSGISFTKEKIEALEDVGTNFTHRRKAKLQLSDIYVWPYLRSVIDDSEGQSILLESSKFIAKELPVSTEQKRISLISAGNQYGKTSLGKQICMLLKKKGFMPILLNAKRVSSLKQAALQERIDSEIDLHYGRKYRNTISQLPPEKMVLIIDDFNELKGSQQAVASFLSMMQKSFSNIILFQSSEPGTEFLTNDILKHDELVGFEVYDLLPLSFELRKEIIEKWLLIGVEDYIDDGSVSTTAAKFSKLVDETLGRNLIPSVPIFVLIILQQAESSADINAVVRNGSHGFLYESLITKALTENVSIITVDTALTYLTALAGCLHVARKEKLDQSDYDKLHYEHCEKFELQLNLRKLQEQFELAGIVGSSSECIFFKYPYLLYYFTAKYLAADTVQNTQYIDELIETIYTEKSANILLFLAHLGKDPIVIGKILSKANSIFSSYSEADIFQHSETVAKYGYKKVRDIYLVEGDKKSQLIVFDEDHKVVEHELELLQNNEKDETKIKDSLQINSAFKTLQVLGQVLRNHAGSIEKDNKREIAGSCISLGLRTLEFLLANIANYADDIIAFKIKQLQADNPSFDQEKLLSEAQGFMYSTILNISVGTMVKVANSIGSEELAVTLNHVLGSNKRNSRSFTHLITQLEHFLVFPEHDLIKYHDDIFKPNDILPIVMLKKFAVRRFYLFPAVDELKRSVCQRLNIQRKPFGFLDSKARK